MDEAEIGHPIQLAGAARKLEEGEERGALARPEAVAQLLEVARQEAGGIAVALARLPREKLRLRARLPHGGDERVLELPDPLRRWVGAGPHGEDHRQPGPLGPQPP